jgi:hypothetical protein
MRTVLLPPGGGGNTIAVKIYHINFVLRTNIVKRDQLEDTRVEGEIILKPVLKK